MLPKKTITNFRSVVLALAMVVGCSSSQGDDKTNGAGIRREPPPASPFRPAQLEAVIGSLVDAVGTQADPTIRPAAVSLKDVRGYWAPIVTGANRAISDIGCPGTVEAPVVATSGTAVTDEKKITSQNELISSYIESGNYKILGIAPYADGDEDTIRLINQFADEVGPVVTIDGDAPETHRSYYIGTDNYAIAVTAAEALADELQSGDKIVVFGDDTWLSAAQRVQGVTDTAAKYGLTMGAMVKTVWDGPKDVAALKQAFNDEPDIKGLVCIFANAYLCAQAVDELGLGGTVKISAFDFEVDTATYLSEGLILGTAVQRQYYMGYMSVLVPYALAVLGANRTAELLAPMLVDARTFDTGHDFVTRGQVDDYVAFLDALGIKDI